MEQMQMNKPDIYDAALYLRLSKDDMEEGGAKFCSFPNDFLNIHTSVYFFQRLHRHLCLCNLSYYSAQASSITSKRT